MHIKHHLRKKELEMLVIGGKSHHKRIISNTFEDSLLRLIFVEKNEALKKKSIKLYDLYCMPKETEENGKIINYMTIIY